MGVAAFAGVGGAGSVAFAGAAGADAFAAEVSADGAGFVAAERAVFRGVVRGVAAFAGRRARRAGVASRGRVVSEGAAARVDVAEVRALTLVRELGAAEGRVRFGLFSGLPAEDGLRAITLASSRPPR
jgi:hypothetical protein